MEPSSSAEGARPVELGADERWLLLELADGAVCAGLAGDRPAVPDLSQSPPILREPSGAFVTLTVAGELNGCIGTLWPREPLAEAVPRLAWEAAFADPRLPRLTSWDYERLGIKISVLGELIALDVASEAELLASLRPGIDGLLLAAGGLQATFLPAVWESLPDPALFVAQLKRKAGIPAARWPSGTRAFRYATTEFSTAEGVRPSARR